MTPEQHLEAVRNANAKGRLRALSVPLKPETRVALIQLAARERRVPRQQAAIMLERAITEAMEATES